MTQPQYLPGCELRTIDLSNGAIEYVWVDFEDSQRHDITADPVSVALGTFDVPGTWHPADLVEGNGAVYKIRAGLLIGSALTYPAGLYYAWVRVTDTPEVIPKRADNMLVKII